MRAEHLVLLVEEPSAEEFLRVLLPRFLPKGRSFELHAFQGKMDLLAKLEVRLRAYANWLPADWRIMVIVDRDDEECSDLKRRLEEPAETAGLLTRSSAGAGAWQVVNRLAIEELEAWYFGDWQAVCKAYPRVRRTIPNQTRYRDPDAITGGTWESLERILQRHGYFRFGLRKLEVARAIAAHLEPARSRSKSFKRFYEAVLEACG